MIQSRQDLKFYIQEDKKRNLGAYHIGAVKYLAKLLYGTDDMKAFRLLKALRKLEMKDITVMLRLRPILS